MMRVVLPTHLWRLAGVSREIELEVEGPVSLEAVLDALETRHPVLRGTIRDHSTKERRAFIRFFACGEDWSHEPVSDPLRWDGCYLAQVIIPGANEPCESIL
jgi:hypothetical protein